LSSEKSRPMPKNIWKNIWKRVDDSLGPG
jgi:hypothetical protein